MMYLNLSTTQNWLSISNLNRQSCLIMGAVSHKTKSFITLNPNFLYHSCTKAIKVAMEIELCHLKQMKVKGLSPSKSTKALQDLSRDKGQRHPVVYSKKVTLLSFSIRAEKWVRISYQRSKITHINSCILWVVFRSIAVFWLFTLFCNRKRHSLRRPESISRTKPSESSHLPNKTGNKLLDNSLYQN